MGILDRFRNQKPPKPDTRVRSASGRGHTEGFLELEELNEDLKGVPGLTIFDRMYRGDGDIRQVVSMVCNPVVGGTWSVVPWGGQEADEKSQKIAEMVKWALFDHMSPNWTGHVAQMLPVLIRSGFAPFEELWTTCDYDGKTYLVPRKLDLRLPRTIERWFQDQYGELVSIVQQLPIPLDQLIARGYSPETGVRRIASTGETLHANQVEILAKNLVYYRLGAEGDNWEGVSLLRPAYKHWYLKDSIEKIDAIAQEREAVGIPICYPPMGATPRQLEEMEKVLAAMRTNDQGYIVAPGPKAAQGAPDGQGWLIEVIGYDRNGSGRDPMPSLEYHTQKIAAAFIAEFMRLGHGQTGARATAQVQADPFLMSVEAMCKIVEDAAQPLVEKIVAYNFPEAEHAPKLQMSLVDNTSLTQLADYVMKLTQVGALFPDQELEDFLRARGDLPPANPASVKKRGHEDDDLRMEVVKGAGPNGDAPGSNAKPQAGKGNKTPTKKPSKSAKQMDDLGMRVRFRPLRPDEEHVNFDGIENYLDDLPDMFTFALQATVLDLSRTLSQGKAGHSADIRAGLKELMDKTYGQGHVDVRTELQSLGRYTLASIRDHGRDGLEERTDHAVDFIMHSMQLASSGARMNFDDAANIQLAAETEGLRSLRRVAMGHGQGSYLQGRHDAIQLAAEGDSIGVLYSAVLDSNTCEECRMADDGVVRPLDDPVRLERRPPNRMCFSVASGHNMCRCIEIPVVQQ